NVVAKTAECRKTYANKPDLLKILHIVEAVNHAEMGEYKTAAAIINQLYRSTVHPATRYLVLLAELAFMSDYKLARRIMTEAVKRMEEEDEADPLKRARGFLVLGEA